MNHSSRRQLSLRTIAVPALALAAFGALSFACALAGPEVSPPSTNSNAALGATAPVLGTAKTFAVLGGSTVTNTGSSTITGDLGVNPGLAITGFPPGLVVGGTTHAGDAVALQAQTDVTAAYGVLAGEACDVDLTGKDLGGLTLVPGVYCYSSSAQLTGALVLDAGGKADAVWVFKTASTLTTASNSSVKVINGGSECNVFWQIGSSATLGTNTAFVGSIFALTSISLTTGAKVAGRALARNGAVTLDDNDVTVTSCASAVDAGNDAAPVPDAAVPPPVDAAPPPVDAAPPVDSSVPPSDAGTSFDTGTDVPPTT